MDAPELVSKLHGIDPTFRTMCESLYPGVDPRSIADAVYIATGVSKSEPGSADTHVMSTNWRNGRGATKGRGRRKIDNTVLSTRFVSTERHRVRKAVNDVAPGSNNPAPSRLAHNIGMGTTAIGAGISAVSLPKHLRSIPGAIKAAKTDAAPIGTGIKNAVGAVRNFSPAEGDSAVKTGLGALKTGTSVLRENPKIGLGLALGAAALHTANLGGEAIATHVLHQQPKPVKQPNANTLAKSWQPIQDEIVKSYQTGTLSKDQALTLAEYSLAELMDSCVSKRSVNTDDPYARLLGKQTVKTKGRNQSRDVGKAVGKNYSPNTAMLAPTKLQALKAPPVVTAEQPKQPMFAKPAKSAAGRSKAAKVKKRDLQVSGEIAKFDVDKQQCFGWASVVKVDGKDVIDKQSDLIEIDDIEEAAYDYVLNSRAGGDMHRRADDGGVDAKATMIESMVFTPEKIAKMGLPDDFPHSWWIGLQVNDPDLWDDVKTGRKTKFSIHGIGQRTQVLVDD
jgi:hypothetical protein